MATDLTGKVTAGLFDGLANLVGSARNALGSIVIALLQELARAKARFLGTPPLVDSSGGTPGVAIGTVTVPPTADTSTAGGATAASINAAADTVMNALATLAQRCNVLRVPLGMGSSPTGPGTVGNGTIAAITVAVASASGDASASRASVALVFADVLTRQRTTRRNVDECRRAVGLSPVAIPPSEQGTSPADSLAMAAIADAIAVAPGTAATKGVAKAAIDAALVVLRDNVAYLARKLDEALQAPKRRVLVTRQIDGVAYPAGTSRWFVAPCAGRFRRVRTVVDALTAGAGFVKLKLGATDVAGSTVAIADASPPGDIDDSGEIADHVSNLVTEGQLVEIVVDAAPTAGAVFAQVEIEPLVVDAAMPVYAGT